MSIKACLMWTSFGVWGILSMIVGGAYSCLFRVAFAARVECGGGRAARAVFVWRTGTDSSRIRPETSATLMGRSFAAL
jgi:hypothetical protein